MKIETTLKQWETTLMKRESSLKQRETTFMKSKTTLMKRELTLMNVPSLRLHVFPDHREPTLTIY